MTNAIYSDIFVKTLIEMLNKWITITGVDPDKKNISVTFDGSLTDIQIINMHKNLQTSIDIDDSYLTTSLLLDQYFNIFLLQKSISLYNLLYDKDNTDKILSLMLPIKEFLSSQEYKNVYSSFLEEIECVSKKIGIQDFLKQKDEYQRKEIFTNSLYNVMFLQKKLHKHVYKYNNRDTKNIILSPYILSFENIETLADVTEKTQGNFISLSLIENSQISERYFVFTIKLGDTIYFIDDRHDFISPIQKKYLKMRMVGEEYFSGKLHDVLPYYLFKFDKNNENVPMKKTDSIDIRNIRFEYQINIILFLFYIYKNFVIKDYREECSLFVAQTIKMLTSNIDENNTECKSSYLEKYQIGGLISKQKLDEDLLYLSQIEEALKIEEKNYEEFENSKNIVLKWYNKIITKNIDNLLSNKKEIISNNYQKPEFIPFTNEYSGNFQQKILFEICDIHDLKYKNINKYINLYKNVVKKESLKTATKAYVFHVKHYRDICYLFNIDVKKIPKELQNYSFGVLDSGANPFLEKINPMDIVKNHWNSLNLGFIIYV